MPVGIQGEKGKKGREKEKKGGKRKTKGGKSPALERAR